MAKEKIEKICQIEAKIADNNTAIDQIFNEKPFCKGFSCKPTWMQASIRDDTQSKLVNLIIFYSSS